jgi:DNA-damage-inducible protein J
MAPETKLEAEQLFSSFGLTITDAVNVFLHQSLMERGFPFQLKQPRYNAETERAIADAKNRVDLYKCDSIEEFFMELEE